MPEPTEPEDPNAPPDPDDPCNLPEPPWYCNPQAPGGEPSVQEYKDEETGFTFAQYDANYDIDEKRIFYRVAVGDSIPDKAPYDAVIQIQAPNNVGWAALAWGGQMIDCPITMAWANCSNVVVTSRYTA